MTQGRRKGEKLRVLGWLMVLGGLLIMSVGLFLEQMSPPTVSSLGLILSLAGIAVLAKRIGQEEEEEEPEVQEARVD